MANFADIFAPRNLSRAIEETSTGVPNPLPPAFFAKNVTEQIVGKETTYPVFKGMRRIVPRTTYTAPPKRLNTLPVRFTPLNITSFAGFWDVSLDLLRAVAAPDVSKIQLGQMTDVMIREARNNKVRFENNRIAHVVSMLRNGAYYYDSSDYLLPNSSGAAFTVDMGVPAANKGQIGGIIDASWATTTTNIVSHVQQIIKKSEQGTGRRVTTAFHGTLLPSMVATNTYLQAYLVRNPQYQSFFTNNPTLLPPGFLGIQNWVNLGSAFYETEAGANVQLWADDLVTFTPDITTDWYRLFEGSEAVCDDFTNTTVGNDGVPQINGLEVKYGMCSYAITVKEPAFGVKVYYKDNVMPTIVNGTDIYCADVMP